MTDEKDIAAAEEEEEPKIRYARGMHPNSIAARKKTNKKNETYWKGGSWLKASEGGKKGGAKSGRSSEGLQRMTLRMMRRNGSISVERYLKAQGFEVMSRQIQELFVWRLIECAIKEGDTGCMEQLGNLVTLGDTIKWTGTVPHSPPTKRVSKTEIVRGRVQKIRFKRRKSKKRKARKNG